MQSLPPSIKMHDIRVFRDREQLSRPLAEALVVAARERASGGGRFSVALAGGSTPRLLYEILATEFREKAPWEHIHFFWSDERYLPPDHADSNVLMAREALFDRVNVPAENIHAPPTDLEDPEQAAIFYEDAIRELLAPEKPCLDWVLLGLGEDGHFASLFPDSSALEERTRLVIAVRNCSKPPPVRLTMTLPLINQAAHVHFLVSGIGKADALHSTLEGPDDPSRWPAQRLQPTQGTLTWWLDDDAASRLRSDG
jgi:6-phosphogluconolactonase